MHKLILLILVTKTNEGPNKLNKTLDEKKATKAQVLKVMHEYKVTTLK